MGQSWLSHVVNVVKTVMLIERPEREDELINSLRMRGVDLITLRNTQNQVRICNGSAAP